MQSEKRHADVDIGFSNVFGALDDTATKANIQKQQSSVCST
jgi:hypothetical protein